MTDLESNVKINYTVDLPMNDTFKEKFEAYLKEGGNKEEGYKAYLLERFLKDSIEDLLNEVRKDHDTFDGKFVLEARNERIKGIFKSPIQVKESVDEPLRRKIFDRFKEITGGEDLRVDINLNCMI